MANKGFFRTVKAFSRRPAILAGALAAAFFASSALFSCSDLNGGYGGTDQGENSSVLILGDLPAGMGRVCGKIKDRQEQNSASKTVAPDSSAIATLVDHYDICAWGTPDSGSPVPESSPIHGTVNASTRAFDISLPFGSWTLRADAIDSGDKIILSKKSGQITLSDDNPVISANFSLDYYAKSDETGKLGLPLSYDTSRITSISYSLDSEPPATGISISDTVDVTGAGGTFNLDGTTNSAFDALPPGTYNLVVEFCDANGVVVRLDQKVQIYSNLTTGKISGSAPYVNSSGQVDVTATVIQKYESSSFYVGGTGASDSNKGTRFDPLLTIKSAMSRIDASSLPAATTEFTIYVQDDVDLAASVSIASGKKIAIVGTKSGSKSAIDGAASYGIAMGGSSLTCKNVTFNKIHGFEISAGQADFANCSITNGVAGSSGNGGGLCVSGPATVTMNNCAVSGCEASYGGAIYTGGQVELKDCLIGAEASEPAQAADTKHSNKATGSGGGIYIAGTGALTLSGSNTISYNYASVRGGGIYFGAGVDFKDCVIKHNLSAQGGGIYAAGGNATMDDTCEIALNVANKESAPGNGFGGGIFVGGGSTTFKMNGGKISGNSADKGGGFYTENSSGRVEINDGEISENHASSQGDGIYHKSSTLEINDGKICDNDESGVYIDNPSGGAWVTMTGGQISGHTDCGVRLLEGDGNNFDMSGGKISGNGIGAYVAQAYDSSMGSGFIMSGGAQLVDNCIYLAKDSGGDVAIIRVKAALTSAELPVATIWPEEYGLGTQVISFANSALATSESAKFAVKDDAEGEAWAVAADGAYGVLKTASIYVDGSAATDGSGTKDSPCKTLANALSKVSLPNSTIIVKNDTTETAALTISAAYPGLTIKSADTAQKTITGLVTKKINLGTAATISKIAFDTWGSVDVSDNVVTVELNDVSIKNSYNGVAGGGLRIGSNAKVKASNLELDNCYASIGGGGIFVSPGSELNADGLTVTGCYAEGTGIGGGICNGGTLFAKNARISGCSAVGGGAGIFNDNGASLVLDGDCDISSQIYLMGKTSTMTTASNPIYVKAYFGLASGASKIPVAVEERGDPGEQFQDGDALVQGYGEGSGAYSITEAQVNCFATSGTALSLEYDGAATPPCGKLVDKSIAGGVTVNLGANILFEIGTPSASGEKARFNVIDNSSGTPTYVTPTSAQIKILQYGTPVYSADAQEVAATYLSEGNYELYCKAVVGGVTYDTTLPFGAGAKYTPLTLEAAVAGAVVTFDNKASGPVTYRVNGGTEQTIASGATGTITLAAVGDKVQFYGDNEAYATSTVTSACSNIACSADCYVYGNIMSLVKSAGFESETALTDAYTFCRLFKDNAHIKNKTGDDLLLPATTMTEYCYHSMFHGCTSLTTAPELPSTTLSRYCYYSMFRGCTSLTTAPELPATTMKDYCYYGMFQDCTSLTAAPVLPATTLANNCYNYMFNGCTSLTAAPELPATTLANYCYTNMFEGCTSLTAAPELPATTLANYCYASMFFGCTSLMTAPELPATTLAIFCYRSMFQGCTSLNSVTCLATDISASNCTSNWLSGVAASGTFTKAASMTGWTIDSASGIPTGWTVQGGGAGGVPAGFVVVEGSTVAGGDKFKDATIGNSAGVFVAGRSVTISTFWICDHEVTQAEYQAVMGANPSNFTGDDNLPVEKVSWYDALVYCNKKSIAERLEPCYTINGKTNPDEWGTVPTSSDDTWNAATCDFTKSGYRLPTEAEWEYAARGGKAGCEAANPTDWAGTDSSSELGTYAWYDGNSGYKTHEVKTKTKNGLDLYDMSGNVWEWCWDWSDSITTTTPATGASSGSKRAIRGGSWLNPADYCSVASRSFEPPNSRKYTVGFRVVRTAQ